MIKLIYKGENPPTIDKEKYLWVWDGVYKYWNGLDWVEMSTSGGKLDESVLPEGVFIKVSELEDAVRGLGIVSGKDGKTLYTWVKYADDANGSGMSDYSIVDGVYKKYIGLAYNKESIIESTLASDYQWILIKGKDGTNGADGSKGDPGKSIRTTVWEAGKNYYDGNVVAPDGNIYLDIVTDKEIGTETGTDKVTYYTCISSHLSDNDTNNLGNTNLWEEIEDLQKPIKTPLVLADKIKADFIDVDDLHVKHLDGADGTFSGTLSAASGSFNGEITAESGNINGSLTIGSDGDITSTDFSNGTGIKLTSEAIKSSGKHEQSGSYTMYDEAQLTEGRLAIQRTQAHATTKYLIANVDDLYRYNGSITEHALFSEYALSITASYPSNPDSQTIYIVTDGSDKGLWVGSTKIA